MDFIIELIFEFLFDGMLETSNNIIIFCIGNWIYIYC